MPSPLRSQRRPRSRVPLAAALALACIASAAAPTVATAAPGSGSVKLTFADGKAGGKAAKALADAGVGVRAIAPARKRGKRVTLPVRTVAVGKRATVALRGAIRFKAGARKLRLRSLRVAVSARKATISGRAGKRRLPFFVAALAKGKARLDRADTTARLTGAKLSLTRKGAKLLRAKLGASGISAGALGKLVVDARPKGGSGGDVPGGGGGGGGGGPESGPIKNPPPVLARPATAVDVSNIAITWYPRDSWIRYLTSGVGAQDGIFATGGATKGAATTSASHPCSDVAYGGASSDTFDYTFHFTPKSGWYDPPTQAAAVYGQGNVQFKWQSHTIDLTASDPEIELNPANPRTIFRFNGSGGTAYPNQRAVLTDLDLAGQPSVVDNTRTYTAVRGDLTEDGQAVFAGFYPAPGNQFGCVTVSFTTP